MSLVLRANQIDDLTATQVDDNFTFVTASINAVISGSTPVLYAVTASYALNGGGGGGGTTTGSFTGSFTGSLFGTASYALGGGVSFPYTGSAIISGSLQVTGSLGADYINAAEIKTDYLDVYQGLFLTGSVGFNYSSSIYNPAAWTAGGAMITGRSQLAGGGTQNAALAFGGYPGSGCTEQYDGTTWTAGGAMGYGNSALAGAGTQTAAVAFGGNASPSCTAEYDGTAWTGVNALITGRYYLAGAGTQNAALAIGGTSGGPALADTEEYDGSTWTAGGALIQIAQGLAGVGTQNAALAIGGTAAGTCTTCTEEYNGTAWSAGGALIQTIQGLAGAGTQNAASAFGGNCSGAVACTEEYDGTTWTAGVAMINARYELAGAGTQTAAVAFGGYSNAYFSCTEEYNPSFITPINQTNFNYETSTGITTISCLIESSAQRYKDNIKPLESQLDKINQLVSVEFDWKSNQKHDIGFIAEQVQEVYPEVVNTNEQGEVEGLSYSKIVAALVKGMQEQQIQINTLTTEINNLKNK